MTGSCSSQAEEDGRAWRPAPLARPPATLPELTNKNARSAEERLVRGKKKKEEEKKKRPVFSFTHGGRTGYPLEFIKRQKCSALYKKKREKKRGWGHTGGKEIAHEYCSRTGWKSFQSGPFIIKEEQQIKDGWGG